MEKSIQKLFKSSYYCLIFPRFPNRKSCVVKYKTPESSVTVSKVYTRFQSRSHALYLQNKFSFCDKWKKYGKISRNESYHVDKLNLKHHLFTYISYKILNLLWFEHLFIALLSPSLEAFAVIHIQYHTRNAQNSTKTLWFMFTDHCHIAVILYFSIWSLYALVSAYLIESTAIRWPSKCF